MGAGALASIGACDVSAPGARQRSACGQVSPSSSSGREHVGDLEVSCLVSLTLLRALRCRCRRGRSGELRAAGHGHTGRIRGGFLRSGPGLFPAAIPTESFEDKRCPGAGWKEKGFAEVAGSQVLGQHLALSLRRCGVSPTAPSETSWSVKCRWGDAQGVGAEPSAACFISPGL